MAKQFEFEAIDSRVRVDHLLAKLNEMGAQGFEVVAHLASTDRVLLQREMPIPHTPIEPAVTPVVHEDRRPH